MNYKYIYNELGEKEAVIIPIKEWENLKNKILPGKESGKVRLADMIGAAKDNFNSIEQVDAHIDKLRDEWE